MIISYFVLFCCEYDYIFWHTMIFFTFLKARDHLIWKCSMEGLLKPIREIQCRYYLKNVQCNRKQIVRRKNIKTNNYYRMYCTFCKNNSTFYLPSRTQQTLHRLYSDQMTRKTQKILKTYTMCQQILLIYNFFYSV